MKYEVVSDLEENCITVKGFKNDFDSDIVLYPIEEAILIVDHLEFLESLNEILMKELKRCGYSDENIEEIIETVEEDLE